MLNELETLSQNIGRLIALNKRYHSERIVLEEQVTQLRAESETVRAELTQLREERDALAAERDTLSSKIDDAQVKLNAILEKLPRATKGAAQADTGPDLLDAQARANDDDAASHGEHA